MHWNGFISGIVFGLVSIYDIYMYDVYIQLSDNFLSTIPVSLILHTVLETTYKVSFVKM